MAKTDILDYSPTPAENQDINGVSILGTAKPSNLDDAQRAQMSHIAKGLVTRRSVKDTAYTAVKTDHNQLLEFSTDATLTTASAATLTDGWQCKVYAQGGAVTINPNGSETVNGEEFILLKEGSRGLLYVNNGNFLFDYYSGAASGEGGFKAYRSTNQTGIGNNAPILFDTEESDDDGLYDPSTGRFVPLDGKKYLIVAIVTHPMATTGQGTAFNISRNGSAIVSSRVGTSNTTEPESTTLLAFVVGNGTDYYDIRETFTGSTTSVNGGQALTRFEAVEL